MRVVFPGLEGEIAELSAAAPAKPPLSSSPRESSWPMVAASLLLIPGAKLLILRSLPTEPIETVFRSEATEFAPSATEFSAAAVTFASSPFLASIATPRISLPVIEFSSITFL